MADKPADVRISKKFTNVACITNQVEQGSLTPLAFEYMIIYNPGSWLTDRQDCIRAIASPATSNKHSYCHFLITSSTRYMKWASSVQLGQAESILRRRTKTLREEDPKDTATQRSSLESSVTLVDEQPTAKSQEKNHGWSVNTVNGFTAVVRNWLRKLAYCCISFSFFFRHFYFLYQFLGRCEVWVGCLFYEE